MTGRGISLLFALLLAAQADTLTLKDGRRVTGRWWSADASQIHFLVDNQLQHYARPDVSSVTFGSEAAAPVPAPAAPQAQAQPLSGSAPTQAGSQPAPAVRMLREPEETGAVYFRNASGELIPLEKNLATERKSGATSYWEMPAAQSRVRLKTAPDMLFVVRLAKGIDPATLSLCPLATAKGSRRTKAEPGHQKIPLTLPFTIAKAGESTYNLTVKDLGAGEYAFSPEGSNDSYCFGVDAGAPER